MKHELKSLKKREKTVLNKLLLNKFTLTLIIMLSSMVETFATTTTTTATTGTGTGTGTGGAALKTKITNWGTSITDALNAAVAVFALVGGFLVFLQYMQGNESAQKNLIRFVIGLAVFGLAVLIAGVFT